MHTFFATAAKGTEGVLKSELRGLGLHQVHGARGGVHFAGALADGMRAVFHTRLAQRVLLEVGAGPAADAEALYEAAHALPWEDHLTARHTFAVRATGQSESLRHTKFTALKVKDAIADRMRERRGARPSVDARRPDLTVAVHLAKGRATFYLDLAGDPLYQRGWRREAGEAPLRETLAAAVLALGGYDPERPLCDPMCGAGTLVVEAALVARRMAPGLSRRFGVTRWPAFGEEERRALDAVTAAAKAEVLPRAPAPMMGRDWDEKVLAAAEENARRAGVGADIRFERRDARDLGDLPPGCQLFVNPPYGERLGGRRLQLEGLFRQLGEAWRAVDGDHPLVVLAGAQGFSRAFGGKAAAAHELYNGPIKTRLLTYRKRAP